MTRHRVSLDLSGIPDDDVRGAANRLVELQTAWNELDADKPDQESAALQSLLSSLQEAQQKLSSLVQQLTVQQTTVVNSVIGYQTAMQRTTAAPRYKDAFVRPLVEFVNNLNRAYESLASRRSRASSITKMLLAEQGVQLDGLANIKQKVQETSSQVQQLEQLVKRNEELLKQLTDVMTALGVNDVVTAPQAPTGVVVPTPVPAQQPAAVAPEAAEAEAPAPEKAPLEAEAEEK